MQLAMLASTPVIAFVALATFRVVDPSVGLYAVRRCGRLLMDAVCWRTACACSAASGGFVAKAEDAAAEALWGAARDGATQRRRVGAQAPPPGQCAQPTVTTISLNSLIARPNVSVLFLLPTVTVSV